MRPTPQQIRETAEQMESAEFIHWLTDHYLASIGGQLTADNMHMLNNDQHTLLAYRYLMDEVMEGGFIQLIQNGYAPYVLSGGLPYVMKKLWGLTDFGKFLFDVRKEYNHNREALEADLTEEEFMALYEQYEKMNEYGDDFLDDYQEEVTPAIVKHVVEHAEEF